MTYKHAWYSVFALIVTLFFILVPPIHQDESYHLFADQRFVWGVANFWNVASNAPFAIAGILGLWKFRSMVDRTLFSGVLMTGFGSAFYHLTPNDGNLIWDRLPMTVVFMAFVTCLLADGESERYRKSVLGLLLSIGIASVIWWHFTNDLRPYAVVRFGPILLVLPFLKIKKDRAWLWLSFAAFGAAQVAELRDQAIYSVAGLSGHTWKHLLAGLATYFLFEWRLRTAREHSADQSFLRGGFGGMGSLPSRTNVNKRAPG